jgi:isocitrate dehydrogenase
VERTKAGKRDGANAEQAAALKNGQLLIKDAIADITLQQVLTRADGLTWSPRSIQRRLSVRCAGA